MSCKGTEKYTRKAERFVFFVKSSYLYKLNNQIYLDLYHYNATIINAGKSFVVIDRLKIMSY
jgi:hypothetical protein